MAKSKVLFIDDDENADWIKTEENKKAERKVHRDLARQYRRDKG